MEPEAEDPWICEASFLEKFYDKAHKNGAMLVSYQLSLSTVQPLQEDHVRRSLVHLRRKCPVFRFCFGERNGNTWFHESKNDNVDFQVVNDMSAEEVREQLEDYQYKSNEGPLWCARLLVDAERDSLAIDEGFPHTSHLMLGVHHSIADGNSLLVILGSFVKILEDVISGKPVCDDEQIGRFVPDKENESLVTKKMDIISNDPALMQELSETVMEKGIGKPLILSAIQTTEEGENRMGNLTRVLDKDETKHFINRCKSEGVTVHSAFTALTNICTVRFLLKNQIIMDSYRLCNAHVINSRRYWSGDTSQTLGCHAHAPLRLWVNIPKDIQVKNFWDFARMLHCDLHYHVKKETPLFREAFRNLRFPEPTFKDVLQPKYPKQTDSLLTNLGNITASLTEGGLHVRPFLLRRHTSFHRTCMSNFQYGFHTFRGRMILNLLWNTKFYTPDFAKNHCDQIFNILKEVMEQ